MNKFKIGDKVRVVSNDSGSRKECSAYFEVGDICVVLETDIYGGVRLSDNTRSWINTEELELVEEEKKVYTEEDIYEGMVLECVDSRYDWWEVGKKYIVDKNLCIYDENHLQRYIKSIVNRLNDPDEYIVKFKVVESEEEQLIDAKLTHLYSIVITVPKKDASGSYVNYNWLLTNILSEKCTINLSKSDRLVNIDESVEYINIEVLHEDLVFLAKTINFAIKRLRNLNQTKLDLKLNGQHFVLDTQEELDYSTTLINGLIGNV